VQYEVLQAGTGAKPGPDAQVTVHYKGTLIDGTEFDSSIGGPPAQFSLAPGGLIEGFREVVQLMPVGSKYRAVIPANLAYGPQGSGSIGPNQTLIFEIELISMP
jgi:FKBP-type peptidyl-prolyl cis-trans isomerase